MGFLKYLLPQYNAWGSKLINIKTYGFTFTSESFLNKLKLRKNDFYKQLVRETSKQGKSNDCNQRGKKQCGQVDLCFNNTEEAFKSKTIGELIRAYFVFLLCSSQLLVNNSEKLMKVSEKILGKKLFEILMKMTFYGHFVAGETKEAIQPKLNRNRKYGVKSILDYPVEEDNEEPKVSTCKCQVEEENNRNEERYDCIANSIIDAIQGVKGENMGFVAVKLTSLGNPEILLKLSEVIMCAREFVQEITGYSGSVISQNLSIQELKENLIRACIKDKEATLFLKNVVCDKNGIIHLFPWNKIINGDEKINEVFNLPNMSEKKFINLMCELTEDEEEKFRNSMIRLNTIMCEAEKANVHVMVDAEQSCYQPAISRITTELMVTYNKNKAVVFNTYQAYLIDSLNELQADIYQSNRQHFSFGVKLVRGAYIDENDCSKQCLEITKNPAANMQAILHYIFSVIKVNKKNKNLHKLLLTIASHNEDTVRKVVEFMNQTDIKCNDYVIFFAQLLGVADYITYPLGQAGYGAYKYVPYGPVHGVLPYLSRKLKENQNVLKNISKEKKLLITEIIRRIKSGQIFYKP